MNRKTRLGIGVDLLLIDGMNLVMKSAFTTGGLSTESGVETGIIYGFLNSLANTARKYLPNGIIVVWEGYKSNALRRNIYDGYKKGRKEKTKIDWDVVHKQLDILHDFLMDLGVGSVSIGGYEADDTIANLTYVYSDKKTVIVTSDRDLLQLVTENVSWYSSSKPIEVNHQNFYSKIGVTLERFVDFKVITGDSSDGINGIKGIGDKTGKELLNKIGLDRYMDKYSKSSALPRTKNLFEPNAIEIIRRNRLLMDLSLQSISKDDLVGSMETSELDKASLMELLEDYSCWSILDSWDDFIIGFKGTDLKGVLNA